VPIEEEEEERFNLFECCFSRRQRKTLRISINWQVAFLFLELERKEAIVLCQCAGNGDFGGRTASIRLV
jgi:hypothetical protein